MASVGRSKKGRDREATRAAAAHFRTEPRLLAQPVHGTARISVEGEIVLHTPEHDPPFQVERCCTRCGSSDPARWPATRTLSVAGGAVRAPDGHRCFWCRCYEMSSGPSDLPLEAAPPAVPTAAPTDVRSPAAAAAQADEDRPWWRRVAGLPA